MKKFLLSMLGVLLALPGIARDFTYEYEGQTLTYTVIDEDAKTCMTKSGSYSGGVATPGNAVSGRVVIPSVVSDGTNEYTVTHIGDNGFPANPGLTEIVFPETLTYIGKYAFQDCTGLTSVFIPASVSDFGRYPFQRCTGLIKSFYPNTLGSNPISNGLVYTYDPKDILFEDGWIYNNDKTAIVCAPLTLEGEYTIPDGIDTVKEGAFAGCSGLTSIDLGSVTTIGDNAFYGCSGLTSIDCGSVTTIGNYAFYGCSGLTSIDFGSVTTIGDDAFYNCTGLTSVILPPSVESIGSYAFLACTGLVKSAYPENFDNPFREFSEFYGLAVAYNPEGAIVENGWIFGPEHASILFAPYTLEGEYTVPAGVTAIGRRAFGKCTGLTSVILPPSVESIGSYAFYECTGLVKSAYPNNLANPFENGLAVGYNPEEAIIENGWIFGPEHSSILYAPYTLEGEYLVPAGVTTIGENAFGKCSSLASLNIPASVTSIGNNAFNKCSGIKAVTFEDGDTKLSIPGSLFGNSSMIETVYLGRNFSYSGSNDKRPFYNKTSITTLTIGDKVTAINNFEFYGCSGLTSLTIPNSVNSIGNSAFESCTGLKTFTIEDGPNSIVFNYNALYLSPIDHLYIGRNWSNSGSNVAISTGITTVEIGNSVTELSAYAFRLCSDLTSVTIPNSVTNIGAEAFSDCSRLTSVTIPNSVTNIGAEAFSDCSRLTSVTIPNSVNSIGNAAFSYCYGLTSAIIPNSVTNIGAEAFRGCSGLTSAIIGNSVTSIGENAFYDCYRLKKSAYPSGLSNPFYDGTMIEYPREGAIIEDGFIYGPEKKTIYFASLSFEGEYDIPESVTSIGENAFYGCSGLTSVKTTTINPPVMNDNSFEGLYATAALSVPEDAVNNYLATNWSLFKNLRMGDSETVCQTYETGNLKYMLLPGKTTDDKNFAVVIQGDYSPLTEVTIPERFSVSDNGTNVRYFVDGIGFNAFKGCSNLSTVMFNSRNASRLIGDYAFAGTKISSLTIPETIEAIGNHAFDGCTSLTGIVIPGSVGTIGDYALNGCTALINANLEAGVKTIGDYAFNGCTAMTGIDIPGSVGTIGDYAFYGCKALTGIDIPGSVKTIGDYAFYNARLNEITLNEGLETIGEKCFSASGYRIVKPIYIPSTLTWVGEDAFSNLNCEYVNISDLAAWCNIDFANENSNPLSQCGSLRLNNEEVKELIIPEGVIAVKQYAFYNCESANTLILPNSLTQLANNAFMNCNNITNLTIGTSLEECSGDNFAGCRFKKLTISDGFGNLKLTGSWDNLSIRELYMGRPFEVVK